MVAPFCVFLLSAQQLLPVLVQLNDRVASYYSSSSPAYTAHRGQEVDNNDFYCLYVKIEERSREGIFRLWVLYRKH